MGKVHDTLSPELQDWIHQQRMFFVATAPRGDEGLVNCSPKGMDTFRVLGPQEVAYLDMTGSGVETIAHLQENGRIVIMFCAFEGAPKILRLHGRGDVITPGHADWAALKPHFPDLAGARSILRVRVHRIADSCGHGVPRMSFVEERDALVRFGETKGEEGLQAYRREKNAQSLDGLPGLP